MKTTLHCPPLRLMETGLRGTCYYWCFHRNHMLYWLYKFREETVSLDVTCSEQTENLLIQTQWISTDTAEHRQYRQWHKTVLANNTDYFIWRSHRFILTTVTKFHCQHILWLKHGPVSVVKYLTGPRKVKWMAANLLWPFYTAVYC